MNLPKSRMLLLLPFSMLVLSQLMCNMPVNEEVTLHWAEELLGLEVGIGLVYELSADSVESHIDDALCADYEIPEMNPLESYEYVREEKYSAITVISSNGRITYEKNNDNGEFCRVIDPNGVACITFLEGARYDYSLYHMNPDKLFERTTCYSALYTLTLTDVEIPGSEVAQEQSAEAPELTPIIFSVEDCTCASVDLPLQGESSRASNNLYRMGIQSGGEVEVVGNLTCDWQAVHQSDQKTGTKRIYLKAFRFEEAQYAQAYFNQVRDEIVQKPPFCEAEPDRCTVKVADFDDERAYYAWSNIYVRGDEEVLPSDQGANIARLIHAYGNYVVFDLYVTHPELDAQDTWAMDQAQAVEACVMELMSP